MKRNELIAELKKRGFICNNNSKVIYEGLEYFYKHIVIYILDGYIDVENQYLIPYRLYLNEKLVIGNKRLLKYVDELLRKEKENEKNETK